VTGWGKVDGDWFMFSPRISPSWAVRWARPWAENCQPAGYGRQNGAPVVGLNDQAGRASRKAWRLWPGTQIFYRTCKPRGWFRRSQSSWTVCRRCGLLARHHRLHIHGREDRPHVHHRAGSGQAVTHQEVSFDQWAAQPSIVSRAAWLISTAPDEETLLSNVPLAAFLLPANNLTPPPYAPPSV